MSLSRHSAYPTTDFPDHTLAGTLVVREGLLERIAKQEKKSQRPKYSDAGLSLVGGVESPATHGTGGPLTPRVEVIDPSA